MPLRLIHDVKNINRFREILVVLVEEGFGFLLDGVSLRKKLPFSKRFVKREPKTSHEVRLRKTLERLGPTFIKFGQVLSVRPDLVPKSYIKELEKLQDAVPPIPYPEVEKILEAEFGKPLHSIFKEFEKKPIAAASISQVHKAVLLDDSIVAVKIQRPTAKETLQADIEIMLYLAQLLENHMPNIAKFKPVQIVREFSEWTQQELDFRLEALHAQRFARNFAHNKFIKIPRIYKHFTTRKIIVMEYIDGTQLHDIVTLRKRKVPLKQLIEKGFEAILTQVFVHGFFHADPHPGNILITKNNKVAFLDFGIVGRFSEELREKSIELFYSVINHDAPKVVKTLGDISQTPIENEGELEEGIEDILETLQDQDLNHVKVSYILEEIFDLALLHNVKIPKEFVLFGKTVVTLEGIALQYDPQFRIIMHSKPFMKSMIMNRYNPARIMKSSIGQLIDMKRYLTQIPQQASRALARIEKGSIKVDIDDTDIRKLSSDINRSSNRVAYSMLIGSLLIMGALTVHFGSPIAFTLPLIPFLSFMAALVLSCVLLWSIVKEKNIFMR